MVCVSPALPRGHTPGRSACHWFHKHCRRACLGASLSPCPASMCKPLQQDILLACTCATIRCRITSDSLQGVAPTCDRHRCCDIVLPSPAACSCHQFRSIATDRFSRYGCEQKYKCNSKAIEHQMCQPVLHETAWQLSCHPHSSVKID